ncbi:hypothetical protein NP233_g3880 [Leucocoprinus birnbaumii]|uniref:Uncharacterized protein n=1 Tax=Leucocoprinus birnbaumii TaxID=56174 RepID=A0AAD5VVR7_9AGAR|nr:hypothetical protein NP233_g3880 [Leucocoprinus birnbaumii]
MQESSHEGEDPEIFYIEQTDGWISFLDNEEFVQASQIFETKLDIFHNQVGEFLELGPESVEWRFPSEKYSFFLLKKQCLTEDQCPKIGEWCLLLMSDIDDCIKMRASSPLPPSSPPPETPVSKHREVSIQANQPVPPSVSLDLGHMGTKRKYSEILEEAEVKAPTVNINVRVVVEGAIVSAELDHMQKPHKRCKRCKRSKRSKRRRVHLGTGTHDDPIDVDVF